jgi:hypothetical protein
VGRRRVAGLELKALAGVYGQPLEHFLGPPGAPNARGPIRSSTFC